MLSKTSELAIRTLLFLILDGEGKPLSLRRIASGLACSPSYLAKTTGLLVKSGLLRSNRGVNGGVVLAKPPDRINLLHVVEACQGLLTADYCNDTPAGEEVCGFHNAMGELHRRTVETLSQWTLASLLQCPATRPRKNGTHDCRMYYAGCERHLRRYGKKGPRNREQGSLSEPKGGRP